MDVQQLFRNLTKEAECPLCLETVNEPKTLPCLHSFCLLCLDKHAGYARRQLQTTIKCPVCLTCFQIPEGDTFGGLPTSFHLNRLVDLLVLRDGSAEAQRCNNCDENNTSTATCYCFVCQNFLCTACFEIHQRLKATRGHRNILVENLQAQDVEELIRRPVMCSQQYHEDQALEYYCEECKVCVCLKCSVVSHNRHNMVVMQKAADEQKMQITDALEKIKAEVVVYENHMKKETELMEKSKTEISAAQRKMTETVDDCIRILTEHKLAMNTKFNEISQAQLKAHATQIENFQFAVTQLKSSVEQGERILERNINAEILQTKQVIIVRCEELLNAKKPEIYKPPHVHYIVENKADILDRVVVSKTDPLQSLVEGQCEKEIEEMTETSFTIVTRDLDGVQCCHGDDHIKVSIQTPSGDELKTEIKDCNYSKHTVTYTPECVGQYRAEIEVNGQHLTGSPWSVQVVPHQEKEEEEEVKEVEEEELDSSRRRYMPSSEMSLSEPQSAKEKQFVESVEQRIERMPQATIREVVRNILDEPIPLEVQERLLKPLLSQKYHPKPPQRLRRKEKKEQKRKNIQNEFDLFVPHENRVVTNYQNEILNLLDVAEYEGEEENGRRFIRWRFIRGLQKDLKPNFMENIRGKVNTAFYIRYVFSYRLRNIDNDTVIVYYINHGSPRINKLPAAEKWLSEQETKRLASDNIKRPSTKWKFVSFFTVEVKVVLDRQPLLGTGPLPDWLRNLARGRPMVALDTYQDNLCLWRCIAVHRGALPHRSTAAARGLAKSFFKLETVPIDCPKTSLDELDKVERHLNKGLPFSDWLGIRVYEPEIICTYVPVNISGIDNEMKEKKKINMAPKKKLA
ncbi:hypothetical protein ACROYT_G027060 [Oculina patagonica]